MTSIIQETEKLAEDQRARYKHYKNRDVAIISAPFSGGQGRAGVDQGPIHVLDEHNLIPTVEELGWHTSFAGHLKFHETSNDTDIGKMKKPRLVSEATKVVADTVYKAISQGNFPLTIGGDHSLAIGTVSGVLKEFPDACLLWIDAHADINTPDTTDSGNLHGCPVSFLLGLAGTQNLPEGVFNWVEPVLKPNKLAYIGLRDVDRAEKVILRQNGIAAYSMHDVDKHGIAKVVEMALQKINPSGASPIHLSFDVDALDPIYAPATGTPVRGGLSLREGCYLCEAVAESGNLVAMDLVEVNPKLGASAESAHQTVHAGISLVKCALGDSLL